MPTDLQLHKVFSSSLSIQPHIVAVTPVLHRALFSSSTAVPGSLHGQLALSVGWMKTAFGAVGQEDVLADVVQYENCMMLGIEGEKYTAFFPTQSVPDNYSG